MDIEIFRRMDPRLVEEMEIKAKEIKQKYFNKKYFFGPNSPATREGLDDVCTRTLCHRAMCAFVFSIQTLKLVLLTLYIWHDLDIRFSLRS